MPNDAKLGLVVGVGLTIAVAVVFFSKEPSSTATASPAPPASQITLQPGEPPHLPKLGAEPNRPGGQVTGWQPQKR